MHEVVFASWRAFPAARERPYRNPPIILPDGTHHRGVFTQKKTGRRKVLDQRSKVSINNKRGACQAGFPANKQLVVAQDRLA
jgi:hypothetical protein